MTKLRSIVYWFVVIFAVAWGVSFGISLLAPIVACAFGVIIAACQSGSTLYLFVSVWIFPALIALITSPFMVDYINLRNDRKVREDAEAEELDADR